MNHQFSEKKKYERTKPVIDNVTLDEKEQIRKKVHSFFAKNEPPTVAKVLAAVNADDNMNNYKISTFTKILHQLNFR